MARNAKKAGADYARDQIASEYFHTWAYEQIIEASQMDPSEVLPLETSKDAEKIAKNMLEQLEWDVKRDLDESPEFFKGFSEYRRRPAVVKKLAREILKMQREIEKGADAAVHEGATVADFSSLDALIDHAANDLGATHVAGDGAHTKIYFPRGGQYPYEEAKVWRKAGYWHAEGPHARAGVASLPREARPIAMPKRRQAAESLREGGSYTVTWAGGRRDNLTAAHAVDVVQGIRERWRNDGRRGTLRIVVYRDGERIPYADLERAVLARGNAALSAPRHPRDPLKPRRGEFDIATRGGGRETVKGYVAGDYGMRKEKYFWEFTHLPTGVKLTTYPVHENLKSALAYLERLAEHGPAEHQQHFLKKGTWGLAERKTALAAPPRAQRRRRR